MRSQARAGFDMTTRVALLEDDADKMDEVMGDLHADLKAIKNVLIGLLISLSTAAVVLALNLAAK